MADGFSKRVRTAAEQMAAAVASGNVSTGYAGEPELMNLSAATLQAQEQHAAALRAFEARQRQHTVVVPTKDEEVKMMLRSLGAPICLFGERLVDRRERLKRFIAERQVDAELLGDTSMTDASRFGSIPSSSSLYQATQVKPKEEKQTKSFFTEASPALIAARKMIAASSWERSRARLMKEYDTPVAFGARKQERTAKLEMVASINEPRPISACSFTPDGHIATASFDEKCRIYRCSGDYALVYTLRGHENRICDVASRPVASTDKVIVATGSGEGQVRLWRGEDSLGILQGHVQRVGRLSWDVTGKFLVSTSFDRTWRLWDAETSTCLLTQDGHAREVYACAFHPDGALVATGDMGAACVVWDLRSSRQTHQFAGHVLGVICADFSPNGYLLATGGLDNQVRVWDLRKKETAQVVPAHLKTVTNCKFSKEDGGKTLVTSSHDRTIKLWDAQTWKRMSSLVAHESLVMGMDLSGDLRIATSGYDKGLKVIEARFGTKPA